MVHRQFPIYIFCFPRAPKTNKQSKQILICMTIPNWKNIYIYMCVYIYINLYLYLSIYIYVKALNNRDMSIPSAFSEFFNVHFFRNACATPPWHIGWAPGQDSYTHLSWNMSDTNRAKGTSPRDNTGDIQNFGQINLWRTHFRWLFTAIYVIMRDL